jgi:hypothetical protein
VPVTETFVAEAGEALLKSCPLVSQDAYASQEVRKKILDYVEKLGYEPSADLVCRFAAPLEKELQAQKEAAQEEARRVAERDARIHRDMNLPSDVDKAEAIAELRARQQPRPQTFAPAEYTQAEIDAMSEEEARAAVFGKLITDLNRSVGPAPEGKKRGRTIKKQAFDARRAAEEETRAARAREIAFDQQQRSKLRTELKAALTKGGQ